MGTIATLRNPESPKEDYSGLNTITLAVTEEQCQWSDMDGTTAIQRYPFHSDGAQRGFLTIFGLERKPSMAAAGRLIHGVPASPGVRIVRKTSGFGVHRSPAGHMQEYIGLLSIGSTCDPETWSEVLVFRGDAVSDHWKTPQDDLFERMRTLLAWAWERDELDACEPAPRGVL